MLVDDAEVVVELESEEAARSGMMVVVEVVEVAVDVGVVIATAAAPLAGRTVAEADVVLAADFFLQVLEPPWALGVVVVVEDADVLVEEELEACPETNWAI